MIGIDTNVLVRFLTGDDAAQSAAARRILESTCTVERPGFISLVVVAELVWALESVYGFERHEIVEALEVLLSRMELQVQSRSEVYFAAQAYKGAAAGFHDVLIGLLAQANGCETTVTFDRKASRLEHFTLLER